MKDKAEYSLRQVVELTGISEFTLRGWESRYRAIRPKRSKTGRRLYTSNDILKAKALLDLTLRGHRIGVIASKDIEELHQLLQERDLLNNDADAVIKSEIQYEEVSQLIEMADQFDWDQVEASMDRLRIKLKARRFIHHFLLPLLSEINHQVAQGRLTIAQEHIISAMIRDNLYTIRRQQRINRKSERRFILATPEGDFHDTGLLIAAVMIALEGLPHLFLGANVPARDLCETALRYSASHILLSSTISKKEGAREDLFDWLNFMDRQLPTKTAIWTAGRNTRGLSIDLKREFRIITNFGELDQLLV